MSAATARNPHIAGANPVTGKNRFLKGVEYKNITLATEQLEGDKEQSSNVSSIEIVLAPPK